MKVLIVEDDADISDSLKDAVVDMGHEVVCLPNGLEALKYLYQTDGLPAVILLDLMMPVMDGQEFLGIRHRDPELMKIPVVIMTAAMVKYLPRADLKGYFRKPVDLEYLERMLSAIQESTEEEDPLTGL